MNTREELFLNRWETKMEILIACMVIALYTVLALMVGISTNSTTKGLAVLGSGILLWGVCRRGLSLEKEFLGVIAAFVAIFTGGFVFLLTNIFWLGLAVFCGNFLFLIDSLREKK